MMDGCCALLTLYIGGSARTQLMWQARMHSHVMPLVQVFSVYLGPGAFSFCYRLRRFPDLFSLCFSPTKVCHKLHSASFPSATICIIVSVVSCGPSGTTAYTANETNYRTVPCPAFHLTLAASLPLGTRARELFLAVVYVDS